MRNPPQSVIDSWPPPNFVDPEYHDDETLFGICIALVGLAAICVALRIYVRIFILHNTGPDDWLIALSLVPAVGLTTSALIGTHFGWGKHIWDNRKKWFKPSEICSWINQFLFLVTMVFIKLSICFSYRRLSLDKPFNTIVKGTIVFVIVWGITFGLTAIFRCWPISGYWINVVMKEEDCIDEAIPLMVSSITNLISDFWLVILPIPTLWHLQLPTRQRVILIVLMGLGLVACTCGITRTFYLEQTLFETYDVTWEGYYVWLWTMAECDVAIVCTSIPPLRPLVKRYFPRILDKRRSTSVDTYTFTSGPLTPAALLASRRGTLTGQMSLSSPVASPKKLHFDYDIDLVSLESQTAVGTSGAVSGAVSGATSVVGPDDADAIYPVDHSSSSGMQV